MAVNTIIHGFNLSEEKTIEEINSKVRIFHHKQSGARLLHMENDDENNFFSIAFRTPPSNSKGIPHILEHSVLCGSRKFPSKEPFVELIKGSLHTFANAMTYPDKTLYPIASTNEKDFFNMMDVYLDAVFYPNIYNVPEIFMQEGWHYDVNEDKNQLHYKGVVYSEMQGVFSSPEQILFRAIRNSLFPDNTYGFESGGNPDVIPELTFEEFTAFHKKYYHPSNSFLFLYGNGNMNDQLEFIHKEYLSNFYSAEIHSEIDHHIPFRKQAEEEIFYPISKDEESEDKTYLSLNFVTGIATNPTEFLALDILEHILLETPSSPLKRALVEAQIGKDIFGDFSGSMLQPIFSIVAKNTDKKQNETFQNVIFDTLNKCVNDGLDKKLIQGVINSTEFHLKEADFGSTPKGLVYCTSSLNSWLYGGHPADHLEFQNILDDIKHKLKDSFFEGLIKKYLIDNNYRSLVTLIPEKGLREKSQSEIRKKLDKFKSGLTKGELEKIISSNAQLKQRQIEEDSPEVLQSIPILTLDDLNQKSQEFLIVEKEVDGIPVLCHPVVTNDISYIALYFDTTVVQEEELPYVSLLASFLGKLSTKNYHFSDLSNELNIHIGGISFSNNIYAENGRDDTFYPKMQVGMKGLMSKIPVMFNLAEEIILNTRFDDADRMREIIQRIKSRMEMGISQSGHVVASQRLFSYFSKIGMYGEKTGGLSYYKFIAELERNYKNRFHSLSRILENISRKIFNRNNLLAGVIQEEVHYNKFQDCVSKFTHHLSKEQITQHKYQFDLTVKNEGLLTPSNVQYVCKGYNFKKLGYEFHGSMHVFSNIASLDYLWNTIRVQGGAYGAFANFSRNGNSFLGTYRDPNLLESLDSFDAMAQHYRSFNPGTREMTKYIIGTISDLDKPLTPLMKGRTALSRYLTHISQADIQRHRDEVLAVTPKKIKEFTEIIAEMMKENCICVLGNEAMLKENKTLFGSLISVFE